MSKYCGNCGTQLEDEAKVCGNCGTPQPETAQAPAANTAPEAVYIDPESAAKNKKRVKIIVGAVALIIVIIIGISIISGFVGYKGAVRKIMNAYSDYNIDELVDMSSVLYSYIKVFDEDYTKTYFSNVVSNDLDYLEERTGRKFKLSYQIKDAYELEKRKYEELMTELNGRFGDFNPGVISAIMSVEVEITAKEGDKASTLQKTMILTKESGNWKILYIR